MKSGGGDCDQGDQRITSFRERLSVILRSDGALPGRQPRRRRAGRARAASRRRVLRMPELAVDEDEIVAAHLRRLADEPVCADRGRHRGEPARLSSARSRRGASACRRSRARPAATPGRPRRRGRTGAATPITNVTAPATERAPCETMNASATKKAAASSISRSPAAETGRTWSPYRPTISEIAPTVPGKIRPGFQSSTTIPISPTESISAMMFGSISEVEDPLPGGHLDPLDLGRRRRSRASSPFGSTLSPSDLAEEIRVVGGDDVDHVSPQRLARAEVGRLRDHLASDRDVAPVLACELADVGGRVVDDLAAEVLGDVLAADRDRRRRADVRLRRHREHVGGHADHGAGGVGARARRARRRRRPAPSPRGSPSRSRASTSRARRACPSRSRRPRTRPPRPARSRRAGTPA